MNECANLAQKLNVKFRCSLNGMSVLSEEGNKFFPLDELYLTNGASCKKYIKQVADPSLQTIFL